MLKEERFQFILKKLAKDQKVLLGTMSHELNVSEYTIRRDIRELSELGLLKVVRGGAVPHTPGPRNLKDRMQYSSEKKQIIADKAITLIKNNQVVIFDGGSSVLALASLLPKDLKITAVTNSFPIANMLEDHDGVEIIFAGGRLLKNSGVTTGFETIRTFQNIRADLCFLGVCCIDLNIGVTVPHYEESEVKKTMVENSGQVIALSLLEKLGTAEPYFVCPASTLDSIITDVSPEEQKLQVYKEHNLNIL